MTRFAHFILTALCALTFTAQTLPALDAKTQPSSSKQQRVEKAREDLLMLLSGEWISRGVYIVAKLEIANQLIDGPKSVETLATKANCNPDALNRIMHMLAGFDVFEEIAPGVYTNSEISEQLAHGTPDSMQSFAVFYGEDIHTSIEGLMGCVKTGIPGFETLFKEPVFSFFTNKPERGLLFQHAMTDLSTGVIKSAVDVYPFSQFKSVYDIGSGHGALLRAILERNPQVKGLAFDLPEAIEVAKNDLLLSVKGCDFVAGNFFESVPEGGDAYILKAIIHDWNEQQAENILKVCHKAMPKDGKLLLIEVILMPKDESVYANCLDIIMLNITGGRERTLEDFSNLLGKAGFEIEKLVPTSTEYTIIQAKKK